MCLLFVCFRISAASIMAASESLDWLCKLVKAVSATSFLIFFTLFLNLISWCPPACRRFMSALIRYRDLPADRFPLDESFRKISSWSSMYSRCRMIFRLIFKCKAQLNGDAPNPRLKPTDVQKPECHLLDFARAGRPLVVVFGSCT